MPALSTTKAEDDGAGNVGSAPGARKPMTRAEAARHASLVRWGKEQPFAARLAALRERKKGGKGGKGANPKGDGRTRQEIANQNRASIAKQTGMDKLEAVIVRLGEGMDDASESAAHDELINKGLAERHDDGSVTLTPAGRSWRAAADRGDVEKAQAALSGAGDKMNRVKERKLKAAERVNAREARQKERESRKKKGGGGGSKPKPKPEEKQAAEKEDAPDDKQRAFDTSKEVGLDEDAAGELMDAADSDTPSTNKQLRDLGLVDSHGETTPDGVNALAALERGDARGYRRAVRAGKARQRREAGQAQREKEREATRAARATEVDAKQSARETGLRQREADHQSRSKSEQDKRVSAEVARIAAARARKAMDAIKQTAQERAMFANMGSSGGGGGGKGGKPTGGQGGLYKQNADGERTPQAGFETKPTKKKGETTGDKEAEARFRAGKLSQKKQKLQGRMAKTQANKKRLSEIEAEVRGGGLSVARMKELRSELSKLRSTKSLDDDVTPELLLAEIVAINEEHPMDELIDELAELYDEALEIAEEDVAEIKAGRRNSTTDQATIDQGYALAAQLCELFEALGATPEDDEPEPDDEAEAEGGEVEMLAGKAEEGFLMGGAVKALDGGRIGGLAIRFSSADEPDMSHMRDYFTKSTSYWLDAWERRPMLYHHGMEETTADDPVIGTWTKASITDEGVWLEGELSKAFKYQSAIKELVRRGALRISTDSAPHLVRRETKGDGVHEVTRWPIVAASLTVSAAEPRLSGVSFKAIMTELGLDAIEATQEATDDAERERQDTAKALDDERSRRLLMELDLLQLETSL